MLTMFWVELPPLGDVRTVSVSVQLHGEELFAYKSTMRVKDFSLQTAVKAAFYKMMDDDIFDEISLLPRVPQPETSGVKVSCDSGLDPDEIPF